MKNIKDISLSIFAVIGFVAILSSFTQEVVYTEKQISNGTPESHVWSFHMNDGTEAGKSFAFAINKKTGEVRKYETNFVWFGKQGSFGEYQVASDRRNRN